MVKGPAGGYRYPWCVLDVARELELHPGFYGSHWGQEGGGCIEDDPLWCWGQSDLGRWPQWRQSSSWSGEWCSLTWELEMEDDKVVFIISVEMISVMSSSLMEPRLTLTSAMRERGSLRLRLLLVSLLVSVASRTLRRLKTKCEVSGVTKFILKAYHILPSLQSKRGTSTDVSCAHRHVLSCPKTLKYGFILLPDT